ncbi:MAG: hypothetical protein ABEN55_02320, partial [Bradymonadaceae bacterium]
EVTGTETGGFRLLATGTRTAYGRDLWHATAGARKLATPSVSASADGSLVADVTLGRDFRAIEQKAPGAVDLFGGSAPALRGADDLERVAGTAGAGAWIAGLHSPAHLYRLGGRLFDERIATPPSFLRLRLARRSGESAPPFHGSLHALFDIGGLGAERQRRVSRLQRQIDRIAGGLPGVHDRLNVGDDGMGRLTLAAGAAGHGAAGESVDSVGPGVQMTIVPERLVDLLGELSAPPGLVESLATLRTLPPVRLATAASGRRVRLRLQMGPRDPKPLTLDSTERRLATLPDRAACLDRLTVALHNYKRSLPVLGPADLEGMRQLLDRLARSVERCRGEGELERAYLEWVLGRAAWLAGWRAEIAWRKELPARGHGLERSRRAAA